MMMLWGTLGRSTSTSTYARSSPLSRCFSSYTSSSFTVAPPMAYAGLGKQVAELMQPPYFERVDQILLQHGIIPRDLTRNYLRKNDVFAVTPRSRTRRASGHTEEESLTRILSPSEKVDPLTVKGFDIVCVASVNDEPLEYVEPIHLAMYKPEGVVCSHSEDEGPSVFDLLPSNFILRRPQLNTVGRLDRDTSGLLLMTQSGKLIHRLTSPRRKVPKQYMVMTKYPLSLTEKEENAFKAGLTLDDGKTCRPAILEPFPDDPVFAKLTIWEGMYHQVRRMFKSIGNEVVALKRISVGSASLKALDLNEPGEWCMLSAIWIRTLLEDSEKISVKRRRLQAENPTVHYEKLEETEATVDLNYAS